MTLSRPVLAALVAAVLIPVASVGTWLAGGLATAASGPITWTTVGPAPYGTLENSGIELNDKLYAFGGYDVTKPGGVYTPTSRAYAFNPATDQWTALAAIPAFNGTGHGGITHAGIATDGTSIYLAGGYSSNTSGGGQLFGARDVYRYNVAANTYTRMPDLPALRAAGGLAYVNGFLYFFGGVDRTRATERPETWALNLANTGAGWVAKAPLPSPRNHLGASVIDGKIYAVGGQVGQDAASVSSAVLNVYDPVANAWQTLPAMPKVLSHTVATSHQGQLVVIGGQTAFNVAVANGYSYNPAARTWTALTPLPAARYSGVIGSIGGKVYYAGGSRSKTTYSGSSAPVPTTPDPTTPTTPPGPVQRFNFQPAASTVPTGYTADTGQSYTSARGRGWVREDSLSGTRVPLDLTANTRERNIATDQRLDTLIHMQGLPKAAGLTLTPGAWELDLAAGTYDVTVAAGEAAGYTDSLNVINVEGTKAIDFQASASVRSKTEKVRVQVSDGKLTIDARGGTNTKLDYIDVQAVTGT